MSYYSVRILSVKQVEFSNPKLVLSVMGLESSCCKVHLLIMKHGLGNQLIFH